MLRLAFDDLGFSIPRLHLSIDSSYAKSRLSPSPRNFFFDMSHDYLLLYASYASTLHLLIERRVAACHHHILYHLFSILQNLSILLFYFTLFNSPSSFYSSYTEGSTFNCCLFLLFTSHILKFGFLPNHQNSRC